MPSFHGLRLLSLAPSFSAASHALPSLATCIRFPKHGPSGQAQDKGFPSSERSGWGMQMPEARGRGGNQLRPNAVLLVFSISRRVKGKMSILIQFRKQMSHESGLEKRLVFTEL